MTSNDWSIFILFIFIIAGLVPLLLNIFADQSHETFVRNCLRSICWFLFVITIIIFRSTIHA